MRVVHDLATSRSAVHDSGRAEAGNHFVRWAVEPSKHEALRKLFVTGLSGWTLKPLHCLDFIRAVQFLGFSGDGSFVVDEIRRVCLQYGTAWGLKVSEAKSLVASGDFVSWAQVQCYLCYQSHVAAQEFVGRLRSRNSACSVLRAWRLDLDIAGNGCCAREDFERCAKILGCYVDAEVIWRALRPQGGEAIELSDLAVVEAADAEDFGAALLLRAELDLNVVWQLMCPTRQRSVTCQHLFALAADLGFCGDTELLFCGLDTSGSGVLWADAIDFVLVLALRWLRPRRVSEASLSPAGNEGSIGIGTGQQRRVELRSKVRGLFQARVGLHEAGLTKRLASLGYQLEVRRAAVELARALRLAGSQWSAGAVVQPGNRPVWDDSPILSMPLSYPVRCPAKPHLHPVVSARTFANEKAALKA